MALQHNKRASKMVGTALFDSAHSFISKKRFGTSRVKNDDRSFTNESMFDGQVDKLLRSGTCKSSGSVHTK